MKRGIAQVIQMQGKEKTELEINTVTESNSLTLQISDEIQNNTFQWISAKLTSPQVPLLYFKLRMCSDKYEPLNFDSSFLFRFFKYINNMATNEGFRNLSNKFAFALSLCLTNSFSYILMLLSSKKLFWKTLNLLRCHCKTESLACTYSSLELLLPLCMDSS